MTWAFLLAGAAAGLSSVPHCAAMCGPLAACASARRGSQVAYHAGRLAAYTALGAGVGTASQGVASRLEQGSWIWVVAGSMSVALLLSAWRLWRTGPARLNDTLVPIGQRAPRAGKGLLLGVATGLLPCGALAAGLLLAASTGDALSGATSMAAFALASAPGLLAWGVLARMFGERPRWRRALAVILVLGALVVLARPLLRASDASPVPACHRALAGALP